MTRITAKPAFGMAVCCRNDATLWQDSDEREIEVLVTFLLAYERRTGEDL
jgi:hypothetical protein